MDTNVTKIAGQFDNRLAFGVERFASMIDVSTEFIRLEIRRGALRPTRLGARVLITRQEADRYLSRNTR